MDHVERFASEIIELLDHPPEREQLSLAVARKLAAFVGRVGVTETGWAPPHEVANAVRAARALINERITDDVFNKRVVLFEIDSTLAIIDRNVMPPQSFS